MRLLVTGAAGMLGADVVAVAGLRGHECFGLSRAELDVTDAHAVEAAIARLAPEAVVNCAAWTDVEGAEGLEPQALAVNGTGAGNLARAAAAVGAHLVQVSTDYVFDGTASRPYVESDPTNALSAYGRTKLAGEHAVSAASGGHAVVRTAWLFGPGGKNFVTTMVRLAAGAGGELAVVTDEVGCPTTPATSRRAWSSSPSAGPPASFTWPAPGTARATPSRRRSSKQPDCSCA